MRDDEFPQFDDDQLEEFLDKCYEGASFDIDDATKKECMEVTQKYNKYTGALSFNAINSMCYSMMKDKATLLETINTLNGYDFPRANIKDYDHPENKQAIEAYKYMHPDLKSEIIRKSLGLTKEDKKFFKEIYDKLGLKPSEY